MNQTAQEARWLGPRLDRGQAARIATIVSILNIITFVVALSLLSFLFTGERAEAKASDDNTTYCLLVENGTPVIEEYAGQTDVLCAGSSPRLTAFQQFNQFVWAITPRPTTYDGNH